MTSSRHQASGYDRCPEITKLMSPWLSSKQLKAVGFIILISPRLFLRQLTAVAPVGYNSSDLTPVKAIPSASKLVTPDARVKNKSPTCRPDLSRWRQKFHLTLVSAITAFLQTNFLASTPDNHFIYPLPWKMFPLLSCNPRKSFFATSTAMFDTA